MPVLDIRNFTTVAIQSSSGIIEMVGYEETADVVWRGGYLGDSATKFDVDGANDADVRLGVVRARFKVRPTSKGMGALNYRLWTLENLRGKVGTLVGKSYEVGTTYTYSCTARCVMTQVEATTVHRSPPLVAHVFQQSFVNMAWEMLSDWNITSV